jgi:hypothetical protein
MAEKARECRDFLGLANWRHVKTDVPINQLTSLYHNSKFETGSREGDPSRR